MMKPDPIGSIVVTYPDGDAYGACDVRVYVEEDSGCWTWHTEDDAGGSDDGDRVVYATEDEAYSAAREWMAEHDEAPGQTAEEYLAAQRAEAEAEAEEDPGGEWCCYWSTAPDDSGPISRYRTMEAAEVAVQSANSDLRDGHHGASLMCGYEVRRLVDGEWVMVDDDQS